MCVHISKGGEENKKVELEEYEDKKEGEEKEDEKKEQISKC